MKISNILKFNLLLLIFMIININCFESGLNNEINTSFEILQSQDEMRDMDSNEYDDANTNKNVNLIQFFRSIIKNNNYNDNNDQDEATMPIRFETVEIRSSENNNAKFLNKLTKFLPKKRLQNKNDIKFVHLLFIFLTSC